MDKVCVSLRSLTSGKIRLATEQAGERSHLSTEAGTTSQGPHVGRGNDPFFKKKKVTPCPSGGAGVAHEPRPQGKAPRRFALLEVQHRVRQLQGEIGEEGDPELVKAALDVRVEHQGSVERGTQATGL